MKEGTVTVPAERDDVVVPVQELNYQVQAL